MTSFTLPASRHPNALGDISVLYAEVLLRAAAAEGARTDQLATRFRLSQQALASPEARISIPRYMRLGHAAIEETNNRALGLRMGALTRPVDTGLAGLTGQAASTAGKALTTLLRYGLLTSQNSRGTPHCRPERRQACFYSIRPYNDYNLFVVDSVLAAWTQFLRSVTGRFDVLERVTIEYASIGLDELFEGWFRCPVHFGASENSITVTSDIWQQPSLQAQPATFEQLRGFCEQERQKIQRGWTTSDRVRHMLTPLFRGETPSLETIAGKMGVAPWTLRRHLAQEDTGFRELVDTTRKQLARDYIRETDAALAEVAWLLGFANPAAFHKAYRRWFALSPGEHRKALRSSDRG